MSLTEAVLDVAQQMEKEEPADAGVAKVLLSIYARMLRNVVKAAGPELTLRGFETSPINPVVKRIREEARRDVEEAASLVMREERGGGGAAMVLLEGGPHDGVYFAAPPPDVPVGAKTHVNGVVYQVTEARGLKYAGELED
jgi:hypothetical protein